MAKIPQYVTRILESAISKLEAGPANLQEPFDRLEPTLRERQNGWLRWAEETILKSALRYDDPANDRAWKALEGTGLDALFERGPFGEADKARLRVVIENLRTPWVLPPSELTTKILSKTATIYRLWAETPLLELRAVLASTQRTAAPTRRREVPSSPAGIIENSIRKLEVGPPSLHQAYHDRLPGLGHKIEEWADWACADILHKGLQALAEDRAMGAEQRSKLREVIGILEDPVNRTRVSPKMARAIALASRDGLANDPHLAISHQFYGAWTQPVIASMREVLELAPRSVDQDTGYGPGGND